MGIYFVAAGSSSQNREKTLDKPHTVEEICQFLSLKDQNELKRFFPRGNDIYIWGANEKNKADLVELKAGEYVIDVKNKRVVQIFRFASLSIAMTEGFRSIWDGIEKNRD